jgi:hypothetical protein
MATKEIFDFGFTAVNEDELDVAQEVKSVTDTAEQLQKKLDDLYNAVQPLLSNLKNNPEKEYIKWPNRLEKVEKFEDLLQEIYLS